jgi:amphi-Trp domain-containing protein
MAKKKSRDIEKTYPKKQFIQKLRRLADSLEKNKSFSIQVHKERLHISADAIVNIEHERSGNENELEFQIKWPTEK